MTKPKTKTQRRRGFGSIRQHPTSGRFQATYPGPDGVRHKAPSTFETYDDADEWLIARRREIKNEDWRPPSRVSTITFGDYAERWLERRTLKVRTREHYGKLLEQRLLPTFGATRLRSITSDQVEDWHYAQGDLDTPVMTSHAYGLLRTILGTAVEARDSSHRPLIDYNPCHIRGAGNVKRKKTPRPASLEQLAMITDAVPERFQLMILFASWCALRFGEVTELCRKDVDLDNAVLRVERAVTYVAKEHRRVIGLPKSDAGVRDVEIPPHLMPLVRAHLGSSITGEQEGLLFPADHGGHLAESTMTNWYYPARKAAGRPDLTFHGLRHTGSMLAATTPGTTLADMMARLGHSTPAAALIYQHASKERGVEIARLLSVKATGSAAG